MGLNFSTFSRRGPDNVTEELVAALSVPKSYEFKALFLVVHAALRERNVAGGGEEMLRLRAYEKLQNLVAQGQVRKTGKEYKGNVRPLRQLAQDLAALRLASPGTQRTPAPPAPKSRKKKAESNGG